MNKREVLTKVREKFADPSHWTKGRSARASDGYPVQIHSPAATCWCMTGAVERVLVEEKAAGSYELSTACFQALADVINPRWKEATYPSSVQTIVAWNDSAYTTHNHVLNVLDKAISQ